jgi:hypothetical protein
MKKKKKKSYTSQRGKRRGEINIAVKVIDMQAKVLLNVFSSSNFINHSYILLRMM